MHWGRLTNSPIEVLVCIAYSFEVQKKLKLTGTPYKIFKNTAFVRNMFSSALEVAKFEGGYVHQPMRDSETDRESGLTYRCYLLWCRLIRTVSGIRGQIKKALPAPAPEGAYRATFEDKVLKSDIVFLRAWVPVQPIKFYNPVTTLLHANKSHFLGMKTVFALRKERSMKIPVNKDSLYKVNQPTQPTNQPSQPTCPTNILTTRWTDSHDLAYYPRRSFICAVACAKLSTGTATVRIQAQAPWQTHAANVRNQASSADGVRRAQGASFDEATAHDEE
jgi:hypothetical protein